MTRDEAIIYCVKKGLLDKHTEKFTKDDNYIIDTIMKNKQIRP